jgi:hypothetical protein
MEHRGQRGFGIVGLIAVLAVLLLIGLGGWYVWQAQTAPPTSQAEQETLSKTPEKSTITFTDERVPFTFEYPKYWTVTLSKSLRDSQSRPDQYFLEVSAPGTVLAEQPIGGLFVTKGARIVVHDSKTALANIQDRFTGFYGTAATDRVDVAVAGVAAVEYNFAYESDPAVFTEFLKDGRIFALEFSAEGDERTSSYFPDYKALMASFKFK